MNFLTLGDEQPDYNLPLLRKYNPESDRPLTEEQQMRNAINVLRSGSLAADQTALREYYGNKMKALKTICERHLGSYADYHTPGAGLAAWIKLKKETVILEVLPALSKLGIYSKEANPFLDEQMPICGIRAGFGSTSLESYEAAFEVLAKHFC